MAKNGELLKGYHYNLIGGYICLCFLVAPFLG